MRQHVPGSLRARGGDRVLGVMTPCSQGRLQDLSCHLGRGSWSRRLLLDQVIGTVRGEVNGAGLTPT